MAPSTLFYLGTHCPNWLGKTAVPLFVSNRRLLARKTLPRSLGRWALDSGGFSELSINGAWLTSPRAYVTSVRRYMAEIGNMDWAAIQDWMCEPFVTAKTGKTLRQHQALTIDSYETLLSLDPKIPWVPVLQGQSQDDYLRHLDDYDARGFDLTRLPLVGIGSICRRHATKEAERIIRAVAAKGVSLHGFGFKTKGLSNSWGILKTADSMAWSFSARREAAF